MPTLEEIFLRVTSAGATGGADPPADGKPANGHAGAQTKGGSVRGALPKPAGTTTNGHANGHANGMAGVTDPQKLWSSAAKKASAAFDGHDNKQQTSGKVRRQPSAAAQSSGAAERSSWSRALVAFREMYRKRALIASRDKKGAVFTLLIPVLAVAFVLVNFFVPNVPRDRAQCPAYIAINLSAAFRNRYNCRDGVQPTVHAHHQLVISLLVCWRRSRF